MQYSNRLHHEVWRRPGPQVGSLLNELNSGASTTAMDPYMDTFRRGFLAGLQRACHKEVTERAREAVQGLAW